jgi:hypothetical protein
MIAPETDGSRATKPVLAALLAGCLVVAALRGGSYAPVARAELFSVVAWVLALAIALGVLPRHRPARGAAVAVGAFVLFVGWMAVGLVWSESAERTVIEAARALGLASLLLLVVLAFGGRNCEGAAALVAAGAALICGLALASRLAPDLLPSALSSTGLRRRLAFPLNYWNGLGAWAAMTVGLALAFSAHARSRWMRGGALGAACVAATVVYMTYSRAAAIATLLAALCVVALSRHRWQAAVNALLAAAGSAGVILAIRAQPDVAEGVGTGGAGTVAAAATAVVAACVLAGGAGVLTRLSAFRLERRLGRRALAGAAAVALVAGALAGPALAERAWESFQRRTESRAQTDPAQRLGNLSGLRRTMWSAGLEAFASEPLHGTGAGTYEYVWNRDPRRDTPVRDAHSLYVEVLAETGLPGALLLLLGMGSLLVSALRAPSRQPDGPAAGAAAGCAAALVVFCVTAGVDWMWELTAVAALGLTCGGLAAAAGAPGSSGLGLRLRGPVVLAALAALGVQFAILIGTAQVHESQQAVANGRLRDAVQHATTAIDASPWAASGYLQRALVLERAGALRRAVMDAQRATEREPTNWRTWLILGRIEAERGRVSAALAAAERARALNPRSPLFTPRPR